jgi:hypothetical protein
LATASSKKCDKVKEKVKAMLAAGDVKNCEGDTCKNKCIDAA